MNLGKVSYKFLKGNTLIFFGNVCVTNTNCEQQIPPKAGFCFLIRGRIRG